MSVSRSTLFTPLLSPLRFLLSSTLHSHHFPIANEAIDINILENYQHLLYEHASKPVKVLKYERIYIDKKIFIPVFNEVTDRRV